ncbi:FAD-dependent thymidylate synthase [Haladaptatus sp. F3-133]|jgi:thymidylate synthase (FAD)|uniref:Flavin-dependent thymidylate synthase n=1 Tax=Halorutilus salinus TaxID=2487751 RepID=A0A9Q4C3E2_9EURY|nr:FAD-dependent thymidylate synthase [Halorutilus salinus]MCX2818230.1 FAD-dependent thymidylate synthase [Halorutilus salinus]
MKVALLASTDSPDELACRAARNDYTTEFVADRGFAEVMEAVDGGTVEEKKANLISQLMERGHYGPFEHPNATFAVRGISRVCMAQITRHRHASFDVQSLRYTIPEPGSDVRGSVVTPPSVEEAGLNDEFLEGCERQFELYHNLIDEDAPKKFRGDGTTPPEDARFLLPMATKVNMVFTLNARALMHVADMRAAADAQWEVRELTDRMLELAEDWMPTTFETYREEMLGRKNRLAP